MPFRKYLHLVKTQAWLGFFLCLASYPLALVQAEESRSYSYDAMHFAIQVNPDTTVDIAETQTYRFIGEYHQGWRNIPKKDFDSLTDVSVTDGTTGQALEYSSKQLDKTKSSSWNKYTTFYKNGEYVIEWYYDARDTTRTWVLGYTLHGALAFYDDHDELYWNLFTAYTVPISFVDAEVTLPRAVEDAGTLKESLYVEGVKGTQGARHSTTGFHFFANDLRPGAKITIASGWPKGLVDTGAYWRWYLWDNIFLILSGITIILAAVSVLMRWFITEKRRETESGPVIAEYEPPQNLRPAMASVIVYERVVKSVWAATLVDLAVRGHIAIREKEPSRSAKFFSGFRNGQAVASIFFLVFVIWSLLAGMPYQGVLILWGLPIVIIAFRLRWIMIHPKAYVLERVEGGRDALESYETKLLAIFFPGMKRTIDLSNQKSAALSQALRELKGELCAETELDTLVYERGFASEEAKKKCAILTLVGALVSWPLLLSLTFGGYFQLVLFCITLYWSGLGLWWFFNHDPRLSGAGIKLKREWQGFKLYLETAERHRLQNLTPETFEKYLPYAMLFGIEKKWGKAFDGIVSEPPSWYRSASSSSRLSGMSSGQFSPSLFSASFASAVSSATSSSSSGSGGASGGGGSAGGGGGGGGGGAS